MCPARAPRVCRRAAGPGRRPRVDHYGPRPTSVGVTNLLVEHFQAPTGTREARVLRYARERSLSELAGRTVWLGAQSAGARRLRGHLAWAGADGVTSGWIRAAQAPEDEDLAADVRPDDIVVLHDPLTGAPAEAIRQRGGHVILARSAGASSSAVNAYLFSRWTAS